MRSGWARSSFSACCIITSNPRDCCSVAAHPITAMMVSITPTGGSPGSRPKTNTMSIKPIPEISPRPSPP